MRLTALLAAFAAVVLTTFSMAAPLQAGGWEHRRAPAGYGRVQVIERHVYRPRYRVNSYADPYRYRYEPRGYYPYYNSGHWVPRHTVRRSYRLAQPRYYKAWGANKHGYHHRSWHQNHHGRHRPWHW
ncbi:MAG: hypothetical protein ACFCUN_03615 [Hyphomicrobiaceae bacterium]